MTGFEQIKAMNLEELAHFATMCMPNLTPSGTLIFMSLLDGTVFSNREDAEKYNIKWLESENSI